MTIQTIKPIVCCCNSLNYSALVMGGGNRLNEFRTLQNVGNVGNAENRATLYKPIRTAVSNVFNVFWACAQHQRLYQRFTLD